jgi:gamma-glutamylcyclotransferase (GGCT)/AIG2-like uncharacterized protein YtfP
MKYVFVYGTLRAGEINDINLAADRHDRASASSGHVAAGSAVRLRHVSGHGGGHVDDAAIRVGSTRARVVGDVYEIDALLAVLDEIERVYPGVDGLFVSEGGEPRTGGERVDCVYYPVAPGAAAGRPRSRPATGCIAASARG